MENPETKTDYLASLEDFAAELERRKEDAAKIGCAGAYTILDLIAGHAYAGTLNEFAKYCTAFSVSGLSLNVQTNVRPDTSARPQRRDA